MATVCADFENGHGTNAMAIFHFRSNFWATAVRFVTIYRG
jgi:hypothetical protein